MKCPKCGYNSFEFHDSCKKCSNDLTGFKGTYGLKSTILPQEARTAMAAALMAATVADQGEEAVAETSDMFSFDLPEEEASTAAPPQNDPFSFVNAAEENTTGFGEFSFDEEPAAPQTAPAATPPPAFPEEDAFASLLESTSLGGDDPFATPAQTTTPQAPATSAPGEFDLDSFSWDEPAAASTEGGKKAEDNFDSLFGDSDTAKK